MFGLGGGDTLVEMPVPTRWTAARVRIRLSAAPAETYVIDSAGDKVSDVGEADDHILASISIDLNHPYLCQYRACDLTGSAALNATGNGPRTC